LHGIDNATCRLSGTPSGIQYWTDSFINAPLFPNVYIDITLKNPVQSKLGRGRCFLGSDFVGIYTTDCTALALVNIASRSKRGSTDEFLVKTSDIRQKAVVRQVQISELPMAGVGHKLPFEQSSICRKCGSAVKVIASIENLVVIKKILTHLNRIIPSLEVA
jgi:hypothetical protein